VTGPRILVVEDNERNLRLVRDVLQHAGFEVVVADSGEQGVDVATSSAPDLVLMDLGLPGIDGAEALRRLRARPETAGLPVVAVTAYVTEADRDAGRRAGFDGFLTKPIDVRSLPAQVRSFLPEATP
jgi:two-component system cell cycle response regulator DivK